MFPLSLHTGKQLPGINISRLIQYKTTFIKDLWSKKELQIYELILMFKNSLRYETNEKIELLEIF